METPETVKERRAIPKAIVALIALWVAAELISYIALRPKGRFGEPLELPIALSILQFAYPYLLIAAVSYGLIHRARFVWAVALAWQAIEGAFGLSNFVLDGGFEWSEAFEGQLALFGSTMPIVVAAVSFVLLLFPGTQRWIRED